VCPRGVNAVFSSVSTGVIMGNIRGICDGPAT
jgi:hypothetical protein